MNNQTDTSQQSNQKIKTTKPERRKIIYVILGIVLIIAVFFIVYFVYSKLFSKGSLVIGRGHNVTNVQISDEQALSIARQAAIDHAGILGKASSFSYEPKISDKYMADGGLVILLDSSPGGFLGQTAVKMDPTTGKVIDVRAGDIAVPGF